MRLAQRLFKPKWQDKDASVRRAAVTASQDAALIEALPRLVREDADAGVRMAALKRLNDYENWRERSTADSDKNLRDAARGVYLSMLCATGSQPTLQRRIAELETLSIDEIERVASTAGDRALRASALERVTRANLLVDRAVTDPDAQLRLAALERVADVNLLERVAERARKSDKAVARRARERIESLRISGGDASAIAERARMLCERTDALMRNPSAQVAIELAAIESEWSTLGNAIPAELVARYRGAHALAMKGSDLLRNPLLQNPLPVLPEPAAVVDAPISAAEPQPDPLALTEAIASRARFDAALAAAETQARNERERRKNLQRGIEQRLPEFSGALESGNSAEAHRLHALIETDLKSLHEIPAVLQQQLAQLLPRYAQLTRWQHWSNNQRRRVLCADIEALSGSGLHPDAIATRVRDARDEWQRMNTNEGISAAAESGHGLSRRFHALCQHALRPTKGYFSKRNEVRKSHSDEVAALLERIAAVADDSNDWKGIAALRGEASTALRALDDVEPQARTNLAKRLKEAIARLAALGDAHEQTVEGAKRRLIEQALALSAQTSGPASAREARELQKKWTTLGNGRRNVDQRQWREFRTACDAVFGKLDAARKEHETQLAAEHAQVQQLLEDFEALAANETHPADMLKTQLRDLDQRWQAHASSERTLLQRQRRAHETIELRIKDGARRQRLAQYTQAMRKYALLRRIETGVADSSGEWDALDAGAAQFDAALAQRHQYATGGGVASEESEAARELLVQLEFLAGVESAQEDRQRRMNHQVHRLSSRMRGGAASASPQAELTELLAQWFAQSAQPDALEQRFERAATAAIDALP